jgi:hypothetical protein
MADLLIHNETVIHQLLAIANREQRPVEVILVDMIRAYEAQPPQNPLLQMAAAADALGLHADRDDISENFDSLLRDSWGEDDQRSGG